MFTQSQRRWLVPLVVSLLIIIADQISKYFILRSLGPVPLTQTIPLIGDWFRLIYVRNTGIAFSLFRGTPQLFTVTSLVIVCGLLVFYWTQLPTRRFLTQLTIGCVVGGAIGNVIDRVRYGYVVDFVQVGWWPVFNVADSAVCVGFALLIVQFAISDVQARASSHTTTA